MMQISVLDVLARIFNHDIMLDFQFSQFLKNFDKCEPRMSNPYAFQAVLTNFE